MKSTELLTLAPIFQSRMVIQRDKPVVVWGNAPENCIITVEFCGCRNTAAVKNNTWSCTLPAQSAGEGYRLSVSCHVREGSTADAAVGAAGAVDTVDMADAGSAVDTIDTVDAGGAVDTIELEDISVGDIWLACGQSNMEFFLRYDRDWETVKKESRNPRIHMYNVPRLAFEGQKRVQPDCGRWFSEDDAAFETFSAPGYSFARNIQPVIGVPIGIIGCNWGGSTASAWLDEAYLADGPLSVYLEEYEAAVQTASPEDLEQRSLAAWDFEDSPAHARDFMPLMYGRDWEWQKNYMKIHENEPILPIGPFHFNRPGGLYRQMLKPLTAFPVKGVLWYQGESDAMHAGLYEQLFTSLITCWRKDWNDMLPFLFVQLAPFEKWLACDASGYPEVRHAQEMVSRHVPNTAMASIMDIGCRDDIHPKQKMEVGRRLALLARGKVYGESLLCESPELEHACRKGDHIELSFKNCGEGSDRCLKIWSKKMSGMPDEREKIQDFRLEQNHTLLPIESIRIEENRIILCAKLSKNDPCTVSYAWADYAEVNLFNSAGLPVKPFICSV